MSGGKDSYVMLDIMLHFQKESVINFDIVAVNLDQKQPGFPEHVLPEYLASKNIEYLVVEADTYSVVMDKTPEGKTTCSLCSRLRRGNLYTTAKELGCNKLALGHHREDIIETFFLNLFFAGKMEAMPPKYMTDDKAHIVLRPLAYCKEKQIAAYAEHEKYPIIPCNLCGTQPKMQRQLVKQMISDWEKEYPFRTANMFTALKKISPKKLLDRSLFDFESISLPRE